MTGQIKYVQFSGNMVQSPFKNSSEIKRANLNQIVQSAL